MDYIYSYSRKQALQDGVLVDVSTIGKQAGIKIPVAVTSEVYGRYIKTELAGQSEEGRLWDTLFLLALYARYFRGDRLTYQVNFATGGELPELVTLKAIIGPDDDLKPVITILLLDQD